MGQRHQIYLNVANPRKLAREQKTELGKGFNILPALNREIILPFHNQWLYGRRAPLSALRVLNHVSQMNRWDKLGNPERKFKNLITPFSVDGFYARMVYCEFNDYIKAIENLMNYDWDGKHKDIEGIGKVSSSRFMGDDKEEYKTMSTNFDFGDNNDGITIIDTITNKYCFMNIHDHPSYRDGEKSYSASDLEPYKPYSARDYMRCYYGESKGQISPYWVEMGKDPVELARENKNANRRIARQFKDYEVLTLDEVKRLFPNMQYFTRKKLQTSK